MKEFFIKLIGKINFEFIYEFFYGRYFSLTPEDHQQILDVLKKGNYIILTRRETHLSTHMANLAHWLLTGRLGYYSHACMNVEASEEGLIDNARFLESVGSGVRIAKFMEIFNCDAVCILKPIMPGRMSWENAVSAGLRKIGSDYDLFFDIRDRSKFSCVEIMLFCIEQITNYKARFHGLLAMIDNEKNLTPDMFIECGSFQKVLEIRRGF